MKKNEIEIKVRFSEIDCLGIANNACFFTWFEIARIEYLKNVLQLNLGEVFDKYRFPVIKAHCKYLKPYRIDDSVYVKTFLFREEKSPIIEFFYLLKNQKGEICAIGMTAHSYVDGEGKTHIEMDQQLEKSYKRTLENYKELIISKEERIKLLGKLGVKTSDGK